MFLSILFVKTVQRINRTHQNSSNLTNDIPINKSYAYFAYLIEREKMKEYNEMSE